MKKPAGIERIRVFESHRRWTTKSGGNLMVVFALPLALAQNGFFVYNETELAEIPEDIRGLRMYTVRDLPKGRIGGTEFHKVREEIIYGLEGSVRWECEDLSGAKQEFILTPQRGIWMPPFMLHTYEVLEDDSGILIVANTLFNPADPRTHDTYPRDAFDQLRKDL